MGSTGGKRVLVAPQAGDVVWIDFSPIVGHEQSGLRPAVVLSPGFYNQRTGRMICCPTTTKIKGFPFEVTLAGKPLSVALADQARTLDWRARGIRAKGRVTPQELAEITAKLKTLIP